MNPATPQPNQIVIRRASRADLPGIHALVRELAIYERAEEEFTATLEEYRADFSAGIFEAMIAEVDDKIAGMVLYYMTYSTWKGRMLYLEDFVVLENYRRMGLGQQLFDAFIREARARDCRLVKWQVLDWNEEAQKFYQKNGATIEKEWWTGKIFLT